MSAPAIVTVQRHCSAPRTGLRCLARSRPSEEFLVRDSAGEIVRCDIDATVGGRFLDNRSPLGRGCRPSRTVLEVDRPRRLVFLFRGPGTEEGEWSKVAVDLADTPAGCSLTLTHEIPAKWAAMPSRSASGWTMILTPFLARWRQIMAEAALAPIHASRPDSIRLERILEASPRRFGATSPRPSFASNGSWGADAAPAVSSSFGRPRQAVGRRGALSRGL